MLEYAPPPLPPWHEVQTELLVMVQLKSVPPHTPPATLTMGNAELPAITQLVRKESVDGQYTPPPLPARPLVSVKPDRLAPWVRNAQRPAPPPLIIVNSGPLTLSSVSGLFTTTEPGYTPLVTTTWSPAVA